MMILAFLITVVAVSGGECNTLGILIPEGLFVS